MSKSGDKTDLTRIEDLAHFEHINDPEVDKLLDLPPLPQEEEEEKEEVKVEDLQEEEILPEIPQTETPSEDFSSESFENTQTLSSEEETPKEEIVFEAQEVIQAQTETVLEEPFTQEVREVPQEETQTPSEEIHFQGEEAFTPTPPHKQESFEDVKSFAQNISYGKISLGGNPPYALIVKNIRYQEDADEILSLLKEHGLLGVETEEVITSSLKQGALLLSQISEYSAVYLAHKLRRFNVDISFGLSETLHQSKNYEPEHRGLVGKDQISQSYGKSAFLSHEDEEQTDHILISTLPTLQDKKIERYLDLLTTDLTLNENDFLESNGLSSESSPYREMALNLKQKALQINANAILGFNFQIIPIEWEEEKKYKIICTGNAVVLT